MGFPTNAEIDRAFAGAIGFTTDEMDYLINNDIKYWVGTATDEDEE